MSNADVNLSILIGNYFHESDSALFPIGIPAFVGKKR
jgi:hypothetical protein